MTPCSPENASTSGGSRFATATLCCRTLAAPWGLTLALFFSRVWQDGARLHVRLRAAKATVEEVAAEIATLNPGVTREALMEDVEVDPEDASRVKGDVYWGSKDCDIAVLPESIGDLTVGRDLNLYSNNLATLPASFGSLTVGGDLNLEDNNLATLPANFGSLQVGRKVYLCDNPVAASRPRFGTLTVCP